MLKIRAIKFDIESKDNRGFGNFIRFNENGLNIIKSSKKLNTSGKTTLIQSILYALGFEQNIDGSQLGNAPLRPVLKSKLEFKGNEFAINESFIELEITNGNKIITLKRAVKSKISSSLIRVHYGSVLVNCDQNTNYEDMYVHSHGSATSYRGFHKFLQEFLELELPIVQKYNGDETKLYLQVFFAPFYVDQIRGWSDYITPITNYGIADVKKRIVEFVLNFDLLKQLQTFKSNKNKLEKLVSEWNLTINTFINTMAFSDFFIIGLGKSPIELSNIELYIKSNDENILLEEYKSQKIKQQSDLSALLNTNIPSLDSAENRKTLDIKIEYYNRVIKQYEKISTLIIMEQNSRSEVITQIQIIDNDLIKNKVEQKLESLGSDENFSIAQNICPTCKHITTSLLPANIPEEIMDLEKNIEFLEGQKKLYSIQQSSIEKYILQLEKEKIILERELKESTDEVKKLKISLIDDSRLPSKINIIESLKVEAELKKINQVEIIKADTLFMLNKIYEEWKEIQKNVKKISEGLPDEDLKKIKELEEIFKKNLQLFNFTSTNIDSVYIDTDTYFPKIDSYKLKNDSSASDFIRILWAYRVSLLEISNNFESNHLGILILDEPAQQTVDSNDVHMLFKKLSLLSHNQIIISTSLQNSEYERATRDIQFNEIDIGERLIQHS